MCLCCFERTDVSDIVFLECLLIYCSDCSHIQVQRTFGLMLSELDAFDWFKLLGRFSTPSLIILMIDVGHVGVGTRAKVWDVTGAFVGEHRGIVLDNFCLTVSI